jgi:hypothetical protein
MSMAMRDLLVSRGGVDSIDAIKDPGASFGSEAKAQVPVRWWQPAKLDWLIALVCAILFWNVWMVGAEVLA